MIFMFSAKKQKVVLEANF